MTKTKRLTKSIMLIVLALIMAMPMIFGGCDLFKGKENKPTIEKTIQVQNMKTSYVLDEELDLTTAIVEYYEGDVLKNVESITPSMILGFTTATVGTRKMYVKFENILKAIDYTVSTLRIEVENLKSVYYLGDSLDLTNAKVKLYINDECQETFDLTANMVSGFSTETVGNRNMKITYNKNGRNYTSTVNYTVNNLIQPEQVLLFKCSMTEKDTGNLFDDRGYMVVYFKSSTEALSLFYQGYQAQTDILALSKNQLKNLCIKYYSEMNMAYQVQQCSVIQQLYGGKMAVKLFVQAGTDTSSGMYLFNFTQTGCDVYWEFETQGKVPGFMTIVLSETAVFVVE